jgi:hypothetical protein
MICNCVLITVIGVTLIKSILTMHRELRDIDDVNTREICIHATSFTLWLLSYVCIRGFIICSLALKNFHNDIKIMRGSSDVLGLTNFISQLILCYILWGLGTRHAVEEEDDDSSLASRKTSWVSSLNSEG